MKLTKILIILTFYFLAFHLSKAQDSTKQFSFPHKTGDMWEYFFDDYSPFYVDTLQNTTIFNSVDSYGNILITQHAKSLNPTKSLLILSDTTIYWIDTTNNYVYKRTIAQDSILVYKLGAKKGDQWLISKNKGGPGNFNLARVKNKWEDSILGKKTTFMSISYFFANNIKDTTGYSIMGGDLIADGFGLIGRGGGELIGQIHLIGAVINGFKYGNITGISVTDKENLISRDIILYPNYPNPFNPSTTISFFLYRRSNVTLVIYDILGNEINRLIDHEDYASGLYKTTWDGTESNGNKTASGIYFYRLFANKQIITKSMILLK